MLTSGSQVGNRKFQGLGTGSSWSWQPLVPTLGTISSNLWELEVPCNVTNGSQVGNGKFQAWEPAVPWLGAIFCSQVANRQFQP